MVGLSNGSALRCIFTVLSWVVLLSCFVPRGISMDFIAFVYCVFENVIMNANRFVSPLLICGIIFGVI